MVPRFQLVPAAYVYLLSGDDDGGAPGAISGATRVLLQLRQNTGYMDGRWAAAAAGHVEQGESVFDAALREVMEELGVGVDVVDLVPATAMHRTDGSAEPIEQRVDWMFTCRRWEGEPRIGEPRKVAALEWFRLDELPLMPPHETYALERLAAGTLAPVTAFGFRPGEVVRGGYARDPHVRGSAVN